MTTIGHTSDPDAEITNWAATERSLLIMVDSRYDFTRQRVDGQWYWVCGIRFIPSARLDQLALVHPYLQHLAPLYGIAEHVPAHSTSTQPTPH